MAMRIAVIAERKAADARIKTSSATRESHSMRSRNVTVVSGPFRGQLFLGQRRSRILRQFVFAGISALHFQFVEEQRRADNGSGYTAHAVIHQGIVADGDQTAAQRA